MLIGYAVFSSTGLLLVNFWKELAKYMEKRRYIILAVILIFQVGLFLGLKLYFFEKMKENINPNTPVSNNTVNHNLTNATNSTNATNHSFY